MQDFSDSLIEDILADKFIELASRLQKEIIIKDGNKFLNKDLEVEVLKLFAENKNYIHNSANSAVVKPLNDLILDIETNVIAGKDTGISAGQTTFNASSDECNIHDTYHEFEFGGIGELDHRYHHTGKGYPGADLVAISDFSFKYKDLYTGELKTATVVAGTKVDAKAYWYLEDDPKNEKRGATFYFDNNIAGDLGHDAAVLFVRIISEEKGTVWYYIPNKAGFKPLKMLDFKPEPFYPHVKFNIADDGILDVTFTN